MKYVFLKGIIISFWKLFTNFSIEHSDIIFIDDINFFISKESLI